MAFSVMFLMMGLLLLIFAISIIGLIFSIVKLRKASGNKGGAIAGLILSIIGLFISLIIITLIFFVFLINTSL